MHIILIILIMDSQHILLQTSILASAAAVSYYSLYLQDNNNLLMQPCTYPNLAGMSDEHFKDNFAFDHLEFEQIHTALKLPPTIKTEIKDCKDSCTALLMLLGYLHGCSLLGLESQFGWSYSCISRIRSVVAKLLLKKWSHLLNVCKCRDTLPSQQSLQQYAKQIQSKCGVDLVWGFVDGTLQPVAHPTVDQKAVYNSWKHFHALKYQIISTPNGLIFAQGPWDGSENDWSVWKKSEVAEGLCQSSFQENG